MRTDHTEPTMADDLADALIDSWLATLTQHKGFAERAIAQVSDDQLHETLAPNTLSIAAIVKHLAGNMRSRFTDFLTTDGEKPDRHRDTEFIDDLPTRSEIIARWDAGWAIVQSAIASLTAPDLDRTVTIRAEPHSVPAAVTRQIAHYAYHTGQIMLIARALVGDAWHWVTIAPGASDDFNTQMDQRFNR